MIALASKRGLRREIAHIAILIHRESSAVKKRKANNIKTSNSGERSDTHYSFKVEINVNYESMTLDSIYRQPSTPRS